MSSYIYCHSGYGLHYDVGVCRALKHSRNDVFYGHGTGAFISVALALNIDMDYIYHSTIDIPKHAFYDILFYIIKEYCEENADAHKVCSGRVYLGILTRVNSYVFVSTFRDNDYLLRILQCSLYVNMGVHIHPDLNIPVLSGNHLCAYNAKYPEVFIVNCTSENNGDVYSRIPIFTNSPPDEHAALLYSLKGFYDASDWLKNNRPRNKDKKHTFTSSLLTLYMKWWIVYMKWISKIYSFEIKTSCVIIGFLYFLKNKNRYVYI